MLEIDGWLSVERRVRFTAAQDMPRVQGKTRRARSGKRQSQK